MQITMLGLHGPSRSCPSVHFSSVAQPCPTLCDPMDCSMPGLPVYHQLPDFTQTHAHWVGDAIQPSHPLPPFSSCLQSFPTSGSFQMSQFFASGGQSIGVSASTSVLPVNIQDWFPLGWTGSISLQSKGLSRVFSNTAVQKRQFLGAQLCLLRVDKWLDTSSNFTYSCGHFIDIGLHFHSKWRQPSVANLCSLFTGLSLLPWAFPL